MIYVAASARELPSSVQEWLSQPGVRAAASSNVYDALALLASRKNPLALIVSMESVDWSELDFFVHAHRVSPDTLLYVAGPEHLESKIEAAMALGARRFDAESLSELLAAAASPARSAGPAGLLAGSLRTDVQEPAAPPRLARPDAPPEPPVAVPAPEEERPPVRLVSSAETEEAETAVPFPWSPAATRPQRTPPRSAAASSSTPEPARRGPVKLSPEELSALLDAPPGKLQEGGS